MTLTDLLRSGECHQLNNHMARVVSGHDPAEAVDDATLLEQALSNLEQHFAAVGVMEQMDRSMALMAERLQWAARPSLPRLNVDPTPGTFHLDDDTRAEILRLNAVDAMVYECVVGSATVALSDVARAG